MKIGIFSGSFDPLTIGHTWIIDRMADLFDAVHVVLGENPSKTPKLTEKERLDILERSFQWKDNIKVLKLNSPTLVRYAQDLTADLYEHHSHKVDFWLDKPEVFIVRGIRNDVDWQYEKKIYECMVEKGPNIRYMYLMSPPDMKEISSTNVKKACDMKMWEMVLEWCGRDVTEALLKHYEGDDWKKYDNLVSIYEQNSGKNWLVLTPDVVPIEETHTAGSIYQGTSTSGHQMRFPDDDATSLGQVASGYYDDMSSQQTFVSERVLLEDILAFNNKLQRSGLLNWAEVITKSQVELLLDPFPHKVAVSEKYYLRNISVTSNISTIGSRYLPHSRSAGPIIVDKNELPSHFKHLGDVIVIEGKHRWLDAKDRGDQTILAWVGEKAIGHFDGGDNIQVLGAGLDDLPVCGDPHLAS